MLTEKNLVLVETGDAWFNGLDLKLPENCQFEIQMQYGSIGWSVGATLGAQVALNNKKRVIALIGDGSFQMTAGHTFISAVLQSSWVTDCSLSFS